MNNTWQKKEYIYTSSSMIKFLAMNCTYNVHLFYLALVLINCTMMSNTTINALQVEFFKSGRSCGGEIEIKTVTSPSPMDSGECRLLKYFDQTDVVPREEAPVEVVVVPKPVPRSGSGGSQGF